MGDRRQDVYAYCHRDVDGVILLWTRREDDSAEISRHQGPAVIPWSKYYRLREELSRMRALWPDGPSGYRQCAADYALYADREDWGSSEEPKGPMPDSSTDWDDEPAPPEGWPPACEMADVGDAARSVHPAEDVGQSADSALSGGREAEQGGTQPRWQRANSVKADGDEGSRGPEAQVAGARRLDPGMRIGLPFVLIICAWFSYGLVVERNPGIKLWVGIFCAAI